MARLSGLLPPLVQLTLMRFREFYREPESIFWVLIFPPLLAAGLGLAFRDAPPAGGSRYIDFLVPGLVGMTLMTSAVWGVGFTIVDARRRQLLKRLVAAPMPRATFLMSFLVYRLVMMVIEAGAVLAFGVVVFGVPLRGSLAALTLSCVMTTLSCTSLGLLIAARIRTNEAVNGLINLIVMPMWLVSGVFFPAQRFPDWLQPAIKLLPLSASIDALRANMLEGAGTARILPELIVLGGWTAICFIAALRIFRWR